MSARSISSAKREWERQRESSIRIHEANQVVLQELRKLEVKDCDIWLGQVEALVEPKEMVEVRHDLNVRRQNCVNRWIITPALWNSVWMKLIKSGVRNRSMQLKWNEF